MARKKVVNGIEYWKNKYGMWVVMWGFINKYGRYSMGVEAFKKRIIAMSFVKRLLKEKPKSE